MHCKPIHLILLTRIKYISRSILGNEINKIAIQDADDYFSEQCIFKDRVDAGKRLADILKLLIDRPPTEFIILAIPRGGVVTGDVIASSIGVKLDIVVSRKIGAPYNPEVAIGAVMHDGSFFPNEDIINMSNVSQEYMDEQISIQKKEIERRFNKFRGSKEYHLRGKNIILVDDGIATGATMFA